MQKTVSIIMPTFNSEKTIRRSLDSIVRQSLPLEEVEILVLDGGSTDKTRTIAKEYGAVIVENKKVQQEFAKHLGILKASGQYCVFLDSDEVFDCKDALRKRVRAFRSNKDVKVILSSGYTKPEGASAINDYINTFADPFSFFMYGVTFNWKSWKSKFKKQKDSGEYTLFFFEKGDLLPLVDMCAGGAIDVLFFRSEFRETIEDEMIVPKIFYMIVGKTGQAAVLKDDSITHYSSDSYKKYLNKLKWRIIANIHYRAIPGTGFANRDDFQTAGFRLRKYFFIPFALTLILPLIVSLTYAAKERKSVLLLHWPLTVYTAIIILYQYLLKIIKVKPKLKTYGSETKVLKLD